jgi:hypothetical protein
MLEGGTMRRVFSFVLVLTGALVLWAGSSGAGASGKFAYTEEIQFPSGSLAVAWDEGGQKRFTTVDYELTATAESTSCMTFDEVTQCIASISEVRESVTGLVPDEKGRVTATLTLVRQGGGDGICGCTLHMEYSNVTLTNMTSGHVYRLDPVAGDRP